MSDLNDVKTTSFATEAHRPRAARRKHQRAQCPAAAQREDRDWPETPHCVGRDQAGLRAGPSPWTPGRPHLSATGPWPDPDALSPVGPRGYFQAFSVPLCESPEACWAGGHLSAAKCCYESRTSHGAPGAVTAGNSGPVSCCQDAGWTPARPKPLSRASFAPWAGPAPTVAGPELRHSRL